MTETLDAAILDLLRSLRGESLTLDELTHELTVLRANGRDMPQVTLGAIGEALHRLRGKVKACDGEIGLKTTEPRQMGLFG